MRDGPSSETASSTANLDLTRVHFYAATNALFAALEVAHRAKNLSTGEWAFHTPEARELLLDYIMQRLDQAVLAMHVDTIQLAQPYKPAPRLRPMKLYRALARRLPTFKADPTTLLTNAQLQQDVRDMIALWIDDTIAGSLPPLIETGWVPRATGKEYSVPNPFLRGRDAGKVRFNVAAMAKKTTVLPPASIRTRSQTRRVVSASDTAASARLDLGSPARQAAKRPSARSSGRSAPAPRTRRVPPRKRGAASIAAEPPEQGDAADLVCESLRSEPVGTVDFVAPRDDSLCCDLDGAHESADPVCNHPAFAEERSEEDDIEEESEDEEGDYDDASESDWSPLPRISLSVQPDPMQCLSPLFTDSTCSYADIPMTPTPVAVSRCSSAESSRTPSPSPTLDALWSPLFPVQEHETPDHTPTRTSPLPPPPPFRSLSMLGQLASAMLSDHDNLLSSPLTLPATLDESATVSIPPMELPHLVPAEDDETWYTAASVNNGSMAVFPLPPTGARCALLVELMRTRTQLAQLRNSSKPAASSSATPARPARRATARARYATRRKSQSAGAWTVRGAPSGSETMACSDENPALLPPAFLLSALFPALQEPTDSQPESAQRDADFPPAVADTRFADVPISRVDSAVPALPSLECTPEPTKQRSVIPELEPPIVPVASLSPSVRVLSSADMMLPVFDLDPAATITPPRSSNISPASSPLRIGEQTGLAVEGPLPPRVVPDPVYSARMDHAALAVTQVLSPPTPLAPLPAPSPLCFTRFDLVAPHDPTYTHFELVAPHSPTELALPLPSRLAPTLTKKLATALVASISESLAAFPAPLPGTDLNLAILAMVLPYVFDVMAVAPSVTERAIYAAGIYPFQGLDLAALVAKIHEFERNVPLSLVRLPTTTAGVATRSMGTSSRRRAADAVVEAPNAKRRRIDDPVGGTSVSGPALVSHPHAAYHALFPAVMQQYPQCDAIGAVAQACVAYACERRLAFIEFQQVLVMGLPVLAEAYEQLQERRLEK